MAQLIGLQAYRINSNDIPTANAPIIDFPFAGIMVRGIPGGQLLNTGIIVYSTVQLVATGDQYLVRETAATIVAAS